MLLLTTALTPGGTWRHLQDLGRGLVAAGADVALVLPDDAKRLQKAADRSGLEWLPRTQLRGRSADVWHIHLHDTYDRAAFRLVAEGRFRARVVITEHLPRTHASDASLATQFRRRPGAAVAKTAFKRSEYAMASAVVAVSQDSAEFLERRYRVPGGKLFIVHNGVRLPTPVPPPVVTGDPLRVLALGSLVWQKGFDVLVDAAARSALPWTVTVIGAGPHRESLEQAALAVPGHRITFLDWVDEPQEHIIKADLVCMPSRWESFPYTALEASSLSRPIVGSNVDGLREIVADGVSGLLVTPENPTQLAGALDGLSADRERLREMGTAARSRAEAYPIDEMVRGALAAYG